MLPFNSSLCVFGYQLRFTLIILDTMCFIKRHIQNYYFIVLTDNYNKTIHSIAWILWWGNPLHCYIFTVIWTHSQILDSHPGVFVFENIQHYTGQTPPPPLISKSQNFTSLPLLISKSHIWDLSFVIFLKQKVRKLNIVLTNSAKFR